MPSIILKETTLVVLSSHSFGLTDKGGGGGTPLYKLYRYINPKGCGFWSENGYALCSFKSVIGYGFRGNYGSV